ncbi:hypothetical protein ACFYXS_05615 [Streptomyces sp. NPDC002574]
MAGRKSRTGVRSFAPAARTTTISSSYQIHITRSPPPDGHIWHVCHPG